MQRPPQMMPVMPSFQPANITTEQIQKCLDENKKLILAILDNQNLGKLAECAQYQAQLQKNLMYLAAIADAQPQMPAMPAQVTTQMAPPPTMQQGGAGQFYMPHNPQAAAAAAAAMTAQQPGGIFPPRMPMQFASPQSQQFHEQQQQHHQQAVQGQMNMRPSGPNNGMQSMMQGPEAALGGSSGVASQTKQQDTPRMGPGGGGDSGNGDGEGSFSRGAEENK